MHFLFILAIVYLALALTRSGSAASYTPSKPDFRHCSPEAFDNYLNERYGA